MGSGPFDQFFAVMDKIDFVTEARQRLIEPIVLFVADPETETACTYTELRHRLKPSIFVPVHNEAVSVTFAAGDFPASRAECGAIRVAHLSPLVRRVIDRPNFSLGSYITKPGGQTQVHQWICPILTKFRELELQLLAGWLATFLGGTQLSYQCGTPITRLPSPEKKFCGDTARHDVRRTMIQSSQ